MNHRIILRTVLGGLVIALALVACEEGPGSSQSPPESKVHVFTIRARDFTIVPLSTFTTAATADYSVSAITAADVEHGLVTADVQTVSGGSWVALPYVFHIGLTNYSVSTTVTYAYDTGGVRISVQGDMTVAEMRAGILPVLDGYRIRVLMRAGILPVLDGYRIRVLVIPTKE